MANVTPQFVAQYPETLHFTEVLANHVGTDISHISITNGSAEAIRYVIQAFTSVNGRVVGVVPSYFMFQVYSEMYGRNFVLHTTLTHLLWRLLKEFYLRLVC